MTDREADSKPIGEMSAEELAAWERALLEDCAEPRPFAYPRAADGSVVRYDHTLGAVVETDPEGKVRLLSLKDGRLHRSQPLDAVQAGQAQHLPFSKEVLRQIPIEMEQDFIMPEGTAPERMSGR